MYNRHCVYTYYYFFFLNKTDFSTWTETNYRNVVWELCIHGPQMVDEDMADLWDYIFILRVQQQQQQQQRKKDAPTNVKEHVKTCGQRWPDIPQYTPMKWYRIIIIIMWRMRSLFFSYIHVYISIHLSLAGHFWHALQIRFTMRLNIFV